MFFFMNFACDYGLCGQRSLQAQQLAYNGGEHGGFIFLLNQISRKI